MGTLWPAIITLAVAFGSQPTASLPMLWGESFSLRSVVRVNFNNNHTVTFVSRVEESYSEPQRRAAIRLKLESHGSDDQRWVRSHNKANFYLDVKQKVSLLIGANGDCTSSSVADLEKLIYLDAPVLGPSVAADHIVGPARLMFFAQKYRNEMTHVELLDGLTCRNFPSSTYRFEMEEPGTDGARKVKVLAEYRDASMVNSEWTPTQITLIYQDKMTISVEFSQVQLLKPGQVFESQERVENGDSIKLDLFTFPPAMGCSGSVAKSAYVGLFDKVSPEEARCSFKAKVKFYGSAERINYNMPAFVAYDDNLDLLRLDVVPGVRSSGVRKQIFDLIKHRVYHVVERERSSDRINFMDHILDRRGESERTALADGSGAGTYCVVAETYQPFPLSPHPLGKLLLGATKFVYMGRAQVRGIDALVYEAIDASMPYWLDQPVEYKDPEGDRLVRDPVSGVSGDRSDRLNVLVYVADKPAANDDDKPELLFVDIQKLDGRYKTLYDKQLVSIQQFAWQLDEAPNGDRATELFSLADHCSAGLDSSHFGRVEMLIESELPRTKFDSSFLHLPNLGHLSILSALQMGHSLPATMIYDLELKPLEGGHAKEAKSNDTQLIVVSFGLAQPADVSVTLDYIGKGYVDTQYTGRMVSVVVRSFQACYLLAAHRRANVYFGYLARERSCTVDLEPVEAQEPNSSQSSRKQEKPLSFVMNSSRSTEIFRINVIYEDKIRRRARWMRDEVLALEKLQFMTGRNLKFLIPESGDDKLVFKIRRVHKKDRALESSMATSQKNAEHIVTDKIVGFGLLETGAQNRRIAPAPLSAPSTSGGDDGDENGDTAATSMTYAQCHAACLSDLECRSFSVCVKKREVQCVLTSNSLRSPSMIKLLEGKSSPQDQRFDAAKRINITTSDQQVVELVRRRDCQLYSKNFLELFRRSTFPHRFTYSYRRVYAVGSHEECAELCFKRNLNLLRDRDKKADVMTAIGDSTMSPESMLALQKQHSALGKEMCDKFVYFDGAGFSAARLEAIQARVLDWDRVDESRVHGYCVVGSEPGELSEIAELRQANKLEPKASYDFIEDGHFETYKFNGETFYEKRREVRLLASPMSEAEKTAYRLIMLGHEPVTDETYSILKSFLERSSNVQVKLSAHVYMCAEICLRNANPEGPWPACRSFDIKVKINVIEYRSECYLNSITLRDALENNRSDLIEHTEYNEEGQDHFWHFEPRPGFVLDAVTYEGKLVMAEQAVRVLKSDEAQYRVHRDIGAALHVFGSLCVVIAAIASGLLFGISLGRRLGGRFEAHDRSTLVDSRATRIELDYRLADCDSSNVPAEMVH